MIGYVVRHRQLGIGKVEKAQHGAFSIRFVASGQLLPFAYAQFAKGGSLVREVLGLGSRCRTVDGECTIERIAQSPTSVTDPFMYAVVFENGCVRVVSEAELEPIPGEESADPQVRLGGLQLQPYLLSAARENMRRAYARMLRDTAGLRALLGSRVDLRPHQAFVAGTVLLEPRRRFILADEVGLGKTIEAGIVIHDLLAQKPDARILVLCPGALSQQWLSELYSKFGGHLFTLLDLHDPAGADWAELRLVICSTTMATFRVGPRLESVKWDMVVVDEVHHLLTVPALYRHVDRLSRHTPAVLLLSAIPAHERADELLRLLALLEPERYGDISPAARQQFAALHEQQPMIGKGLRVLERRIDALETGEVGELDVCAVAARILETPAVSADRDLRDRLGRLCADAEASRRPVAERVHEIASMAETVGAVGRGASPPIESRSSDQERGPLVSGGVPGVKEMLNSETLMPPAVGDSDRAWAAEAETAARRRRDDLARSLRRWAHDVADRYRLSRRILRNRRQRLIERQQIVAIERKVDLRPYAPHRLELEAADALELLLRTTYDNCAAGLDAQFLAFAKIGWQSAASADGLTGLLSDLATTIPEVLNDRAVDFLTMGQAVGYDDWSLYTELLRKAIRAAIPPKLLKDAMRAAAAWQNAGVTAWSRFLALHDFLLPLASNRQKLILFAGYPGLAQQIAGQLASAFGVAAVATFRSDQSMEDKEASALRFQQDAATWLLVSDESGGEGRNFQFAGELVHVDTPWHVARVEQRIGRLDRLGRERVRTDVVSHVFYSDASVEAGLVHCLDSAVGVYRQSISGLEFALRDVERAIATSALSGGVESMIGEATPLAAMVAQERERDDAESVLDEASYEVSAAGRFRAIARSDRVDAGIESAMVDYMRRLTEGRGVRKLDTPFGPGAVVRFQPEKTCFGALPVDGTGTQFLAGNYDGTFRRSVAQLAPRLHFFNVSDPLFNAVINSLDRHATGRAFGIELLAPGHPPWVGLECRFVPTFDPSVLGSSSGLRNRLDALFIPKPLAVLIDLHGVALSPHDADAVVALRRRVEYGQCGQTWWDLSAAWQSVARALDPDSWADSVAALVAHARQKALSLLKERLSGGIAAEQSRVAAILEVISEAANRGDEEAADQVQQYAAFTAVLPLWRASLDAVGLVSVNGGLRLGRLE